MRTGKEKGMKKKIVKMIICLALTGTLLGCQTGELLAAANAQESISENEISENDSNVTVGGEEMENTEGENADLEVGEQEPLPEIVEEPAKPEAGNEEADISDAPEYAPKKKEEAHQEYLRKIEEDREERAGATSEQTMIGNEYLEFMVDSNGRFTIGNVEGNPDYTSDNGAILLYGHDDPGTSFSTIRMMSSEGDTRDLVFKADSNIYDTVNRTVTSVMEAEGFFDNDEAYHFRITQYLEFIQGAQGRADTVKISYKIENMGQAAQKAGVRIMMDTMLADNDDAPFKVVGHGNVTSELELRGREVTPTYQVYDNLEEPTTFATGSLYLGNDRRPDKVQFARWDYITDTDYDYEINDREFGDSAVAVYFDPVNINPSAQTNVCTYYGVNSNLMSGEGVETIDESQYGVLVYDSLTEQAIADAEVVIGDVSVRTGENGLAVFDDFEEKNGEQVTVKVIKDGYITAEMIRNVLCGSFTGIGIVDVNAPQEPSIQSVVMQSGASMYDLLTTYVYYDEADQGEEADDSITIRVENTGDANAYRLVQAGSVKYESKDGVFEIPIVTKDKKGNPYRTPRIVGLSAGKKVELQIPSGGLGSKKATLGLKIATPTFSAADSAKGSIEIGDKIKFTVPEDVFILGGAEFNFGIVDALPVAVKVEEGGKFRVSVNGDLNDSSDGDAWDKFEKSYNDMLENIDKVSKLHELCDAFGGSRGGNFGAGPLKLKCNLTGYGEGVADSNGNLNVEVGIILELQEEKDFTHYIFVSAVPIYINVGEKGEIATQIKGNLVFGDGNFSFVGGDCTIKPSFQLSVEGGVGVKGAVSVSAEGALKLSWEHRFTGPYDRVWLNGSVAIKLKLLLFEAKKSFPSGDLTIWESDRGRELRANLLENAFEEVPFTLSRRELSNDRAMAAGDLLMLEPMYTDVQETIVQGSRHRFYLADDSKRADPDRTTIVYQKYEDGAWTQPVQLDDDGTADVGFSLASDGNDIYVAWENMDKQFSEDVSLSEMVESSTIRLCKLDAVTGEVTKLYDSPAGQPGAFSPSVCISDNGQKVKVVWYSNSNNYIYGNAQGEAGKDSVHYAEIPVGAGAEESGSFDIDAGHIISLAAGVLDGKDIIVYSVDKDGDFETQQDIALYAYTEGASVPLADTDAVNTNARILGFDGKQTLFYYSGGNIAYTETGRAEDVKYVFDPENLPSGVGDNFSVLQNADNAECSILWKKSNEQGAMDIYAVDYQSGKWSEPYALQKNIQGTDVSIPSGYIDENGAIRMSYGCSEGGYASVMEESVERYVDVVLDSADYAYEDVQPGSGLGLELQMTNKGRRAVENVHVDVLKDGSLISSQIVNAGLGVGQTGSLSVPAAFTVPEDIADISNYEVEVWADGETERGDNVQQIVIGYTDISVKEDGRYMAAGNEYIALKVSNLSKITARNVRMRVFADSRDGVVVYDETVGDLPGGSEKIYNVNVNQLSGSAVAYALASSATPDCHAYNDEELLAINPYAGEIEDVEKKDIQNCTVILLENSFVYDGTEKRPGVAVNDGDAELVAGLDYILEYRNNIEAGTASVVVTGVESYTGTKTVNFTIEPAETPTPPVVTAKRPQSLKFTGTGSAKMAVGSAKTLKVTGNKTAVTYKSSNANIVKVGKKNGKITAVQPGQATITAAAAGNSKYYRAEAKITIKVVPKKAALKSLAARKKQVTVKSSALTKGNTGYKIQYKYKGAAKVTTKTVKSKKALSYTIKNAKSGKRMMVRICAYKKVGGKTYTGAYSAWKTSAKIK